MDSLSSLSLIPSYCFVSMVMDDGVNKYDNRELPVACNQFNWKKRQFCMEAVILIFFTLKDRWVVSIDLVVKKKWVLA